VTRRGWTFDTPRFESGIGFEEGGNVVGEILAIECQRGGSIRGGLRGYALAPLAWAFEEICVVLAEGEDGVDHCCKMQRLLLRKGNF
jgi:hypothetical protein